MSASIPPPTHGVSDVPVGRKARTDVVTASIPAASRQLKSKSSTSSLSKFSNPRTKKPPHTHPHPRPKLALPPLPKSAEVFSAGVPLDDGPEDGGDEGQWFWYEGKRIYVRRKSKERRRRIPSSEDCGGSDAEDGFLGLAANGNGTAGDDVEEMIGDDEYDCGWAMDLGAGSPSISGSPAPGGQPDFGSSSFSSFSSSSSSSSSTPPHEEPATIASDQLGQSLSRRMTINNDTPVASPAKANGAGAVYKRDTEEETGDRLLREWAVAVAGKGEVVTPSVPSSTTVGRRSRGASVSQQLPPLSGTHNRSRSSSRSGRRGSVSTSNTNSPSTSKTVWTDPADRDCGICFEYAVKPARTMCCGNIFCKEHLDDWLTGPNASGLCPNCDAPCSPEDDTLSLASPSLTPFKPSSSSSKKSHPGSSSSSTKTPRRVAQRPVEHVVPSSLPSSSLSIITPTSQPPANRNFNNLRLSPSLLNVHQQYERLLAQEHRASSPLSTSVPIVNPFDSLVVRKEGVEGRLVASGNYGHVSEGGRRRTKSIDVQQELGRGVGGASFGIDCYPTPGPASPLGMAEMGVHNSQFQNLSSSKQPYTFVHEKLPESSAYIVELGSEPGVGRSGIVEKKRLTIRADGDFLGTVRHLVSLAVFLVFVYLVASR